MDTDKAMVVTLVLLAIASFLNGVADFSIVLNQLSNLLSPLSIFAIVEILLGASSLVTAVILFMNR